MSESAGKSAIGRVRKANEDEIAIYEEDGLFVVADGMGGRNGGKIAARSTVAIFADLVRTALSNGRKVSVKLLEEAVMEANRQLLAIGQKAKNLQGMGTTLTAALIDDSELFWVHVGDSRLYRIRKGTLEQLSTDHVTHRLRRAAAKSSTPFIGSLYTTRVLTRVVGVSPSLKAEMGSLEIKAGDLFLLCTDGLTDRLTEGEILAIADSDATLDERSDRLIEAANSRGGEDNITVLLISLKASGFSFFKRKKS